jgi:hypothetical protein
VITGLVVARAPGNGVGTVRFLGLKPRVVAIASPK